MSLLVLNGLVQLAFYIVEGGPLITAQIAAFIVGGIATLLLILAIITYRQLIRDLRRSAQTSSLDEKRPPEEEGQAHDPGPKPRSN